MTDVRFPPTALDGSLEIVSKSGGVATSQILHFLQTVIKERFLSPNFGRNVSVFDRYPSNVLLAEKLRLGLIKAFGDIGFIVTAERASFSTDRLTITVKIGQRLVSVYQLSRTGVSASVL